MNLLNSRDLHTALGLRSHYATWVKDKIKKLSLDADHYKIVEKVVPMKDSTGATKKIDYYVTKEAAILFAATERGPKGQAVVTWLIGKSAMNPDELLDMVKDIDIPEVERDLYIYAIKEVETGAVKIGISCDPLKRIKTLQTGNSSRLEIVAIRHAPNGLADERAAHERLKDFRVRGEWFSPDALKQLPSTIKSLPH